MPGWPGRSFVYGRPFKPPCALISSGETTVTIKENCGQGGPNQEFALAFCQKLKTPGRFACASVDSDGTDGPTDFAGGVVDHTTLGEARRLNVNIGAYLKSHDSAKALADLGGLIVTGHTGTQLAEPQGDPHPFPGWRAVMRDLIERIEGREILGGTGRPTVEARLMTRQGLEVEASVPSGTSKGKHEAFELYDGGKRYRGFGVRQAVENINKIIAPALKGMDVTQQRRIDETAHPSGRHREQSETGRQCHPRGVGCLRQSRGRIMQSPPVSVPGRIRGSPNSRAHGDGLGRRESLALSFAFRGLFVDF